MAVESTSSSSIKRPANSSNRVASPPPRNSMNRPVEVKKQQHSSVELKPSELMKPASPRELLKPPSPREPLKPSSPREKPPVSPRKKQPPPVPIKPAHLDAPPRGRSNGVSAANPVAVVNPDKVIFHGKVGLIEKEFLPPRGRTEQVDSLHIPTLQRAHSADSISLEKEIALEKEKKANREKEKESKEKEIKKSDSKEKSTIKSLLHSMKLPFQSKKNVTVDRVAQYLKDMESQPFSILNTIADAIETSDTWTTKKYKAKDWKLVQVIFLFF